MSKKFIIGGNDLCSLNMSIAEEMNVKFVWSCDFLYNKYKIRIKQIESIRRNGEFTDQYELIPEDEELFSAFLLNHT